MTSPNRLSKEAEMISGEYGGFVCFFPLSNLNNLRKKREYVGGLQMPISEHNLQER